MAVHKRHGDAEDRQAKTSLNDDDRAWGPIFGVMIISGLIMIALLFFLNSPDTAPQHLSHSAAGTPSPAQPGAPPTRRQ
jgi:hypothetical protein